MSVSIRKYPHKVEIRIGTERLDGENDILEAINKETDLARDIHDLIIDFENVSYINSLGISELINIHRIFSDANKGSTHLHFINVDRKVRAILELVDMHKIAEISSF